MSNPSPQASHAPDFGSSRSSPQLDGLATARELTNTGSPIDTLGPELLYIIFKMLRDDKSRYADRDILRYSDKSWAAVTHVSRAWRSISLGYAPLWDELYLGHRAPDVSVDVMLARSGSAPLTVVVCAGDGDECDIDEVVQAFSYAIEHHSHRIKALEVYSHKLSLFTDVFLSPRNFPSLERIDFTNTGEPVALDLFREDAALRLPSLASIVMRNATVLCASKDFRTSSPFLHLDEFYLGVEEESLSPGPEFLVILSKMPVLWKLVVTGTLLSSADANAVVGRITLPRGLKMLAFVCRDDATPDRVFPFVKKLDWGETAVVFYTDPSPALTLAHEYFGAANAPIHTRIYISSTRHASIGTARRHSAAPRLPPIMLEIDFDDEDEMDDADGGLSLPDICADIDRRQLGVLELASPPRSNYLVHAFEHIWGIMDGPAITIVMANGMTSVYALLYALYHQGEADLFKTARIFVFAPNDRSEVEEPSPLSPDVVHDLVHYAYGRKVQGIPIGDLSIWPNAMGEREFSVLRQLVNTLWIE